MPCLPDGTMNIHALLTTVYLPNCFYFHKSAPGYVSARAFLNRAQTHIQAATPRIVRTAVIEAQTMTRTSGNLLTMNQVRTRTMTTLMMVMTIPLLMVRCISFRTAFRCSSLYTLHSSSPAGTSSRSSLSVSSAVPGVSQARLASCGAFGGGCAGPATRAACAASSLIASRV